MPTKKADNMTNNQQPKTTKHDQTPNYHNPNRCLFKQHLALKQHINKQQQLFNDLFT
jgi:hypothetical protein